MKRAYVVGAVGVVLGSLFGMVSCSEETATTPPGRADSGDVTDSTSNTDGGGDDSTPGSETTPTDGTTGGDAAKVTCPATTKAGSIASLMGPGTTLIKNDGVKLSGVIATSRKFRLSSSPKKLGDDCLYGVFVADANATFLPYSGTLVLSYGLNAVASGTGFTCPLDTDLVPKDVAPGDKLDLIASFDSFGPTAATCSGGGDPIPNPDKMRRLYKLCEITKTGTGAVPAPAVVPPNDLSTGAEVAKWMGGYVKIENVEASSVLDFGAFKLKNSTLEVSNDIYYRGATTAPKVDIGDKFTSITGLSYLDFCTWVLMPNTCGDMIAEPSAGQVCPTANPMDAGPPDMGTDTAPAADTASAADSAAADAADGG